MDDERVKICKDALQNVLCTEFSPTSFSLDGYDEDAVCLKDTGTSWEVFIGFRGIKKELMVFDNIIEACFGVIRLFTQHNEPLRAKLGIMFTNTLIPTKQKISA